MKRYVAEPGSELVRKLMADADAWFVCRVGFLETARAVGLAGSPAAMRNLRAEWPAFGVIEADQQLVEDATELVFRHGLRSLDALHLAAALALPRAELTLVAWDRRLHAAANAEGLTVSPPTLD